MYGYTHSYSTHKQHPLSLSHTHTVPEPFVNLVVNQNRPDPYTGGFAELRCAVSFSGSLAETVASIRLLKNSVEVMGNPPRVMVGLTESVITGVVFQRLYTYDPVSRIADSGSYMCEGIVSPSSAELQPFVINGNSSGESVELNFIGKYESVNFDL